MKRFLGEIYWIRLEQGSNKINRDVSSNIKRAILKDNIFSIDIENSNELASSEIRLRSNDGYEFKGSAKYINSHKSSAIVNLFYYFNEDKAFLRGEWIEDKVIYLCWLKLDEVEKF